MIPVIPGFTTWEHSIFPRFMDVLHGIKQFGSSLGYFSLVFTTIFPASSAQTRWTFQPERPGWEFWTAAWPPDTASPLRRPRLDPGSNIGSILMVNDGIHVTIYSSTMDPTGMGAIFSCSVLVGQLHVVAVVVSKSQSRESTPWIPDGQENARNAAIQL
jgi:hypothetical protein